MVFATRRQGDVRGGLWKQTQRGKTLWLSVSLAILGTFFSGSAIWGQDPQGVPGVILLGGNETTGPEPIEPVAFTEPLLLSPAAVGQVPPVGTPPVGTTPPAPLTGTPVLPQIPPQKALPGFGPKQIRLPLLPGSPAPLGTTPVMTPEVKAKLGKYVQNFVDPESTLDLVVGRTRIMMLKETPRRVQLADEGVAGYNLASQTELMLQGKSVGTTVLNLWFADPNDPKKLTTLSYLVRVLPDPEAKTRLEQVYKALEDEINRTFPRSSIQLSLVGDKLTVTGRAYDYVEGTQILRILRANAPGGDASQIPVSQVRVTPDQLGPDGLPGQGAESFSTAGGANVINLLQVMGEQQVMLRVVVAEVNRTAARSIGLNFSLTNQQGVTVFSNKTGLGAGGGGGGGGLGAIGGFLGGLTNMTINLDAGRLPLFLEAMRSLNYSRSLAEPILVTLNGQPANFQAGGQFPVPATSGGFLNGFQGVAFVPFGVQLSFTPFITDKDRIRLSINANVSARDIASGTNIGGAAVTGLTTRNFNTTVELREGETLAVAGLIQNNLGADAQTVPLFGDLPLVGPLAGRKRVEAGEQELLILITPELVHPKPPGDCFSLPGSDLFEPNDIEFYLCGRIESHRNYDYRSPIRTDMSRILQYQQIESKNLIGPCGYSD